MIERIDYEEDTSMLRDEEISKTFIVPVVYYKRIHAENVDRAIDIAYRDATTPFQAFNFNVLEDEATEEE